jgi:hypothetical protein
MSSLRAPAPKLRFSPEEDELLTELVQAHGTSDWPVIASFLPDRNARQCRERWTNYVNPKLVKKGWTREEDALLVEKYNELGPKWATISRSFEGRGRNNLKNRLWAIQRKKARDRERFPGPDALENTARDPGDISTRGIFALLNQPPFDPPGQMSLPGLTVRRFVMDREKH